MAASDCAIQRPSSLGGEPGALQVEPQLQPVLRLPGESGQKDRLPAQLERYGGVITILGSGMKDGFCLSDA
jgi:hypothetical protein